MKFEHPEMDRFLHRGIAERLGVGIVPKDAKQRAEMLRRGLSELPLFNMIERGGDKETCVDLMGAAMDSTARHALDCVIRLDDVVHSRAVTALATMELMHALSRFFGEVAESMVSVCSSHVAAHRETLSPEEQAKYDEAMERDLRGVLDDVLGKILDGLGKR